MYTASRKIQKDKGAEPTAFDETVAQKGSSVEDEAANTSNQQPNQVVASLVNKHACTESEPELKPELKPEVEFDKEPDVLGLPLPSAPLQEHVARPPPRKRKPCYGWICSDDEEDSEVELVFLDTEYSLLRKNCRSYKRKCKSRWDIKPEDM